jgi:prevent-host-death family protein
MRSIGAAKFKEECLAILDNVDDDGILITKRGKPVAKLIPIHAESAELIGAFRDEIKIHGDIESTGVAWDAES